jgi:hypothetical protein
MQLTVKVNYHGRGITALKAALRIRGLVPEYAEAFRDIDRVYRAQLRDRFVRFSRGGGNWRKLAPSTLAARRNRNKGSVAILRDTSAMFASFQPTILKTSGMSIPKAKLGFDVNFGRPASHYSGMTTDRLMRLHHTGAGRLPARKLIVGMDDKTAKRAAKILDAANQKILNRRN